MLMELITGTGTANLLKTMILRKRLWKSCYQCKFLVEKKMEIEATIDLSVSIKVNVPDDVIKMGGWLYYDEIKILTKNNTAP